jgi:hypothetical protein
LYGQEAANGVIMITTKSGKEGSIKVNLNASLQVDNAVRIPEIQDLYGPGAAGFYKEQTGGGWGPLIQNGEQIYDNVSGFLSTGIYQKYDVSASGGSKNFNAYGSASYSDTKGVVPDDYLNKISVMLKGSYNFSKNLSLNLMSNIVNNKSRGFGNAMSSIYNWPINDDMSNYKNPDGSIRWRYLADNKQDSPLNPYWSRYEDYGQTQSTRNIVQGSLLWKAFKNFEITGKLNYDQTNTATISYTTPRFAKSDFTKEALTSVHLDYFGTFSTTQSRSQMFMAQVMVMGVWAVFGNH